MQMLVEALDWTINMIKLNYFSSYRRRSGTTPGTGSRSLELFRSAGTGRHEFLSQVKYYEFLSQVNHYEFLSQVKNERKLLISQP